MPWTAAPAPGTRLAQLWPRKKDFPFPFPGNPLAYGKLGVILRSVNGLPAFPAGAVHSGQLARSLRARMEHMAGGPHERECGSLRRRGAAWLGAEECLERGCSKQVPLLSLLEGAEVWACTHAFCIPGRDCIRRPLSRHFVRRLEQPREPGGCPPLGNFSIDAQGLSWVKVGVLRNSYLSRHPWMSIHSLNTANTDGRGYSVPRTIPGVRETSWG